jgi:hypothetical protein
MMRRLKLMRIVFVISLLCFLHGADPSAAKAAPADSQKKDGSTVIAYYFHGDYRCYNCMTIEQYSKEAIEKYFPGQLKSGKLAFSVLNIDLPENAHFVKDYQLYTRTLIIAEFKNGKQVRWTSLTKVWDYIKDRDAFHKYVKTEIDTYLKSM